VRKFEGKRDLHKDMVGHPAYVEVGVANWTGHQLVVMKRPPHKELRMVDQELSDPGENLAEKKNDPGILVVFLAQTQEADRACDLALANEGRSSRTDNIVVLDFDQS